MSTIAIAATPTKASSATMTRGRTKKDISVVSISDYSMIQSYLTWSSVIRGRRPTCPRWAKSGLSRRERHGPADSRVASEISKRTTLFPMSMGAGSGCDAQYLFAEDVLGYSRGHQPRHAKVYRNFRAEYERLQRERVAAFQEFRADVEKGAYPEDKHLVPIADAEFESFVKGLAKR